MHATDPQTDFLHRAREVLDWTVFMLGVLSLGTAITATVLTKTDLFSQDDTVEAPRRTG